MNLSVRPATAADVPLILTLIRELADYERLLHEVEGTEELLHERGGVGEDGGDVRMEVGGRKIRLGRGGSI